MTRMLSLLLAIFVLLGSTGALGHTYGAAPNGRAKMPMAPDCATPGRCDDMGSASMACAERCAVIMPAAIIVARDAARVATPAAGPVSRLSPHRHTPEPPVPRSFEPGHLYFSQSSL